MLDRFPASNRAERGSSLDAEECDEHHAAGSPKTDGCAAEDATPEGAEAPDVDETTAAPPGDECEGQPVNTTDDLRTCKIFELRNKIASGDYEIDAETIAKRIVDDI